MLSFTRTLAIAFATTTLTLTLPLVTAIPTPLPQTLSSGFTTTSTALYLTIGEFESAFLQPNGAIGTSPSSLFTVAGSLATGYSITSSLGPCAVQDAIFVCGADIVPLSFLVNFDVEVASPAFLGVGAPGGFALNKERTKLVASEGGDLFPLLWFYVRE